MKLYLSGQAAWFLGSGLNMVLYPWLVAVVLKEDPEWVGITQMATMAPSIILMMPGAAMADRMDLRRQLMVFQAIAALPSLLLILILASNNLTTGLVIFTAALSGSVIAFVVPARDSLLNRVAAPGAMQKAVTLATLTQFAAMLVGIMIAGSAGAIGAVPIIAIHAIAMCVCVILVWRQPAAPPLANTSGERRREAMRMAAKTVRSSTVLLPPILGMLSVGIFFVGSFLVLLPIQVRDVYQGGAFEIALVNICFWVGTIVATTVLLRIGQIQRQGRLYLCALFGGIVVLTFIGIEGPFWWLCGLCFVWGIGAGINMTMGRTMVQENAPANYRAQVLALFTLGFMGGAPGGAFIIGYLIKFFGPHDAAFFPAAGMLVMCVILLTRTGLWHYRASTLTTAKTPLGE